MTTQYDEHPLYAVLLDVMQQVMYGKGERHGGASVPFLEQQWVAAAKIHGIGFLTGQSQKKLVEAMMSKNMITDPAAFERELLGAIAYLGMAVIHFRASKQEEYPHHDLH